MSMLDHRNTYPANTPLKVLSTVRHGTVINAPRYLGASVNSTGSSPITRKASTSSVTTIVPTSAAIADAVRPLTASAVISAPNSLVKLIASRLTTNCSAPKWRNSVALCRARTYPMQKDMAGATVPLRKHVAFQPSYIFDNYRARGLRDVKYLQFGLIVSTR